jgi:glycine/D-amino acid oxidase-like deaminating enzyme
LSPAVDEKLHTMLGRLWPGIVATRSWAGIAAFTCDGLPLVGPLPGHPRQVACVGYGGADWSFALRAGQAVADGLLTGETQGLPARFSPARFN